MTLPATDYNEFVKNPGAADESQIVTRGFRMYVRPYLNGVINAAGEFLSLGATKSAYQNLRLGGQGEAWPRLWSATSCGS